MIDTLDKCKVKCEQYDWCQGVSYTASQWICTMHASRNIEEEEEELEGMNEECSLYAWSWPNRSQSSRKKKEAQFEQAEIDYVIDHATPSKGSNGAPAKSARQPNCYKRTSGWV